MTSKDVSIFWTIKKDRRQEKNLIWIAVKKLAMWNVSSQDEAILFNREEKAIPFYENFFKKYKVFFICFMTF